MGGLSENESSIGSITDVYLSLYIKYERDAEKYNVTVKNGMDGYYGGYIGVGDINPNTRNSPYSLNAYETVTYKLQAYDNQKHSNGDTYIFNDVEASLNKSQWMRKKFGKESLNSYNASTSFKAASGDDGVEFIAYLKKLCNINFTNDFSGTNRSGTMLVNGHTSFTVSVVKNNAVTASAQTWYTFDGIDYYFDKWSDGSTARTTTFYPDNHTTYTANYVGKPSFTNQESGLRFNSYNSRPGADNRIRLYWDEHQNPAVTKYAVWRKGKDASGTYFNDGNISVLNRGTTTYTDNDYILTNGWTDATLQYAVTAYYSTEGSWSDLDYKSTNGESSAVNKETKEQTVNNIIKEYSITNYPNPYNPSTKIFYQMPENGQVTIKVFDMLGREIAELVNGIKNPGRYEVNFDGSDLASGTYIYQIIVRALSETGKGYSASRKMLLIK
jgi:hypothetical protein